MHGKRAFTEGSRASTLNEYGRQRRQLLPVEEGDAGASGHLLRQLVV
jgi:hypothetical protein